MAPRRAACLALLPALLWAVSVLAQARPSPIPQDSKRGYIRHVQEMAVTVDDKAMQLAAGAIIRDRQNLIIVPVTIPREGAWAAYNLDRDGQVFRVWLLTPDELARPGPGGG
ncbi:MAG TPA: hypothetical protein VK583_04490 [Burkholderiales bacterium]|jgi:hypothetical protein|nr:hypothetical protein [Burkholderiales bacterium]